MVNDIPQTSKKGTLFWELLDTDQVYTKEETFSNVPPLHSSSNFDNILNESMYITCPCNFTDISLLVLDLPTLAILETSFTILPTLAVLGIISDPAWNYHYLAESKMILKTASVGSQTALYWSSFGSILFTNFLLCQKICRFCKTVILSQFFRNDAI